MSLEDDYKDFMEREEKLTPEDVFSMVTIMPKRKIKVTAHLEDKDGEIILVKDIADDLVKFINGEMQQTDSTAVNSQLFPMAGQFMTSIVPRFIGIPVAGVMFESGTMRHGILTFGLASMLLMQYIQQHELKIVTTVTDLSDDEIEDYIRRSRESEERLKRAIENIINESSNEPENL